MKISPLQHLISLNLMQATRVGVVTYSDTVENSIYLNTYGDEANLTKAISGLKFRNVSGMRTKIEI